MTCCKSAKSGSLERVFDPGVICDVISALNDATKSECLGAASAVRVQRSIAGCTERFWRCVILSANWRNNT